jgi:iron(III) transport system ATP-binding protein
MVRPTGIKLVGTDGDEYHLAGTVADVAFRGRGYEHAIDLPGYGRLTGVFASTRAARGEAVRLRLEPEGCHLFPQAVPSRPRPRAHRWPAGRARRASRRPHPSLRSDQALSIG